MINIAQNRATLMLALIVANSAASANARGPLPIEDGQRPQVVVEFADLNLNTASGVAELDKRIRSASDRVCFLERGSHFAIGYAECVESTRRVFLHQRDAIVAAAAQGQIKTAGR